jgi:integrase
MAGSTECPEYNETNNKTYLTKETAPGPAHRRALKASEVAPFVLYDLRHACLTRWAKYLDPFTLKKLAGHESLETTMRYIHLNESETEARLKQTRDKLTEDAVEEFNNLGITE